MNILMMTNTYLPHVGGVARSVAWFTEAFRAAGHRVIVVAPTFEGVEEDEEDVIRVTALQNFNGSDFSVRLPRPALWLKLDDFQPDIVHSHHPFLMGNTALRTAVMFDVPIVFTHHTMYERYTHYVPGHSTVMQRYVMQLATEYANLCDTVIAPSESIAEIIRERGVTQPVVPVPTGIDPQKFAQGNAAEARQKYGIAAEDFVVGHVGRLAPEKNLAFLTRAVKRFLDQHPQGKFLVVGSGSSEEDIAAELPDERLVMAGRLDGSDLADAYHAMDVFAFASHTETQGMVLAEAMTAGKPVVAVDAPGAREVVKDKANGRLLPSDDEGTFAEALAWVAGLCTSDREKMHENCHKTADAFSMERSARRMLKVYEGLLENEVPRESYDESPWNTLLRRVEEEWNMMAARGSAMSEAFKVSQEEDVTD